MALFQRLNMDSSWYLQWEGLGIMIDPWLIGSEIDGFKWLNEQWHRKPPLSLENLPDYQAILITQSYQDHCHPKTLAALDPRIPILAVPKAYKKLKKDFPDRVIEEVKSGANKELTLGTGLSFRIFTPLHRRDPVYYSILIQNSKQQGIFYAPHGFDLKPEDLDYLNQVKVEVVMSTFIEFQLPNWMGGKVNPGLENVAHLLQNLKPQFVLNTHDEDKKMRGLVARLAKVKRPDFDQLEFENGVEYKSMPDYQAYELAF